MEAAVALLGSPWMLLLDFLASLGTIVAYRCVETREIPWWKSLLVCFVGYQGASGRRNDGGGRCAADPTAAPLGEPAVCFACS